MSNEENQLVKVYIGDYTTQLCGDYNKPLQRSLINNHGFDGKYPSCFFSRGSPELSWGATLVKHGEIATQLLTFFPQGTMASFPGTSLSVYITEGSNFANSISTVSPRFYEPSTVPPKTDKANMVHLKNGFLEKEMNWTWKSCFFKQTNHDLIFNCLFAWSECISLRDLVSLTKSILNFFK